eukprot:COSAG01_NODE_11994_length_1820_cov_1.569436_2_plen_118_part_00
MRTGRAPPFCLRALRCLSLLEVARAACAQALPLRLKLSAALVAGAMASFACNPVDLVRVRLQQQQGRAHSLRRAFAEVWREGGWRALYRGVGQVRPRLIVNLVRIQSHSGALGAAAC